MTRQNTYIFIVLIALVFCMCCISLTSTTHATTITLDNTNIITDLQDFDINTQNINLSDYEFNDNKDLEIINFVEFGYAYRVNRQENFNIYIYIYNPKNLTILKNSTLNKLQMSTNGNDYVKYNLRYCSDLFNKIYKFKLLNVTDVLDTINEDITADRVYDVSGIELKIYEDNNATEFDLAKTFEYSGFASCYGVNVESESTLFLNVYALETIPLRVYHTNYRTGMSNLGANYQNDLSSVYFSIPEQYTNDYGGVYEIMAEWWEYRLNPILITTKNEIYNNIDNVSLYGDFTNMGMGSGVYDWAYNGNLSFVETADRTIDDISLKYLVDNYDAEISKTVLTDDINSVNINDLSINTAMPFGRTKGHNLVIINNDNYSFDLLNYSATASKWEQFLEFGYFAPEQTPSLIGVKPIYNVLSSDLQSNISDNLLINQSDVGVFENFANSEINAGNSVYLFRFANVPYWSDDIYKYELNNNIKIGGGYLAQENVYLDFDIIQLTFFKNDVYSILPVVSSPQDIINDVTPPLEDVESIFKNPFEWLFKAKDEVMSLLEKIMKTILLVVTIIILIPILPYLIKFIVFIVMLPVRLIKSVIKNIKKAATKSKKKKTDKV